MRRHTPLVIGCFMATLAAGQVRGQSYVSRMADQRREYIRELVADERSPVKKGDVKFLRFYEPDSTYKVKAKFTETPGSMPFMIETHSGKKKPYKQFGILTFKLRDTSYSLEVYQSLDLIKNDAYAHHLFLPFKDLTNYESTYGGGRYIDLKTTDIVNGELMIDFNTCYNPYCAYGDGFSCPIPPAANYLPTMVEAGEKNYQKQ